nr:cytochrome c biogenesis protein ResB [Bacillus subtilis]
MPHQRSTPFFPREAYLPPGAQADTYYKEQYGTFGQLYYLLGFHHLYGSWWYLLLIASIGISLVICSLDRVIPLYRALKNQGVRRSPAFLRRQRLFSETVTVLNGESKEKIVALLKKKHYRIREKEGSILAEKGRFFPLGPVCQPYWIDHLFDWCDAEICALCMYVDETLWVREGETAAIPGTDGKYYLKNNQFSVETYNSKTEKKVFADAIDRVGDGRVAKNFQTDAVLYKREGKIVYGEKPKLKKVTEEDIRVNQPLRFDSFSVYSGGL